MYDSHSNQMKIIMHCVGCIERIGFKMEMINVSV